MGQSIFLETERLCIRDHLYEDIESHHELFSNPSAMYYLQDLMMTSWGSARENLIKSIQQINEAQRTEYFFRIEDKVTHEHIGEIGYTVTAFTPVGKIAHLGYFSYEKHWNKGYITEAVWEVLRYAFEENEVYRMTTGCISENQGSERIMQKCGMIQEGIHKEAQWHDGKMKDRVSYRLLKKEWDIVKNSK